MFHSYTQRKTKKQMNKQARPTDPQDRTGVVGGDRQRVRVSGACVESAQLRVRTPACDVVHLMLRSRCWPMLPHLKKRKIITLHAKNTAWQIN